MFVVPVEVIIGGIASLSDVNAGSPSVPIFPTTSRMLFKFNEKFVCSDLDSSWILTSTILSDNCVEPFFIAPETTPETAPNKFPNGFPIAPNGEPADPNGFDRASVDALLTVFTLSVTLVLMLTLIFFSQLLR